MDQNLKKLIKKKFDEAKDKIGFLNEIREFLHELSPLKVNPVDRVLWVEHDKVVPNDYNPNVVAQKELELLHISIKEDGYTQPVVTYYDKEKGKYIVVDGFHRYYVLKNFKDLWERNKGLLPIVVVDKNINERMASTIRHNRARGHHQIIGMSRIVFDMLDNGWTDEEICKELGMEPDELIKLKHITGFSKLFENVEYRKAWENLKQLRLKKKWQEEHPDENGFEYETKNK